MNLNSELAISVSRSLQPLGLAVCRLPVGSLCLSTFKRSPLGVSSRWFSCLVSCVLCLVSCRFAPVPVPVRVRVPDPSSISCVRLSAGAGAARHIIVHAMSGVRRFKRLWLEAPTLRHCGMFLVCRLHCYCCIIGTKAAYLWLSRCILDPRSYLDPDAIEPASCQLHRPSGTRDRRAPFSVERSSITVYRLPSQSQSQSSQ